MNGIQQLMATAKTGDVVAFCGNSWLSASINMLTYGVPFLSVSHVGIVCEVGSDKLLFESLAHPVARCYIRGEYVKGTQAHLLADTTMDCGRVYLYPISYRLYDDEARRLTDFLLGSVGRPYDVVGALRAGGWLTSLVSARLHREETSALFCSEWVASALCEIGVFQTGNVSRWSPQRLCRVGRHIGVFKRPLRIC
jgi:hypothetical protein